jgi:ribosomal-protein-alanine N-acetyltransferase
MHALWTDRFVRRYLWDDAIIPRTRAAEVVESHLVTEASDAIGYWTILHQGEAAGFCGFRFIDGSRDVELMYGVRESLCGMGLATEAARGALSYFWHARDFDRVYARTDPPNARSVDLMRRLGMAHESTTSEMITYVLRRPKPAA